MRKNALVLSMAALLLALAGSIAGATTKPRLGKFGGTEVGKAMVPGMSVKVKKATELGLQVRRDRGRLYVTLLPPGSQNLWKQSFEIVSDRMVGGKRVIEYRRPAAGSRSARWNERQLNQWLAADGGAGALSAVRGRGVVEVSGGTARWKNVGKATLTTEHGAGGYSWDETFVGKKGAQPAMPDDLMRIHWDHALTSFRKQGGLVWKRDASGIIEGVNPKTGQRLEMAGNLQDGISIRLISAKGKLRMTNVTPDGRVVTYRPAKPIEQKTAVIVVQ